MNLVVFDIDGTLTKSSKVDLTCFAVMIRKMLGIAEMNTNLAEYEHATASYIFRHLFHSVHGRNPRPDEIEAAQKYLLALLKQALSLKPGCVKPIPGAVQILAGLRKHPNWQVAIASGGWRCTAIAKLEHAGIDHSWIPKAFADDALSREVIVGRARENTSASCGVIHFDKVICVGDGLWDLRAARNLGYGFVGITAECDPLPMARHGARVLLPDFSNPAGFLRAIECDENIIEDTGVRRMSVA